MIHFLLTIYFYVEVADFFVKDEGIFLVDRSLLFLADQDFNRFSYVWKDLSLHLFLNTRVLE